MQGIEEDAPRDEELRRRVYRITRLEDAIRELRSLALNRQTGPVTIHFFQGGVRGMTSEHRVKATVLTEFTTGV
jgi:hypothetical protein